MPEKSESNSRRRRAWAVQQMEDLCDRMPKIPDRRRMNLNYTEKNKPRDGLFRRISHGSSTSKEEQTMNANEQQQCLNTTGQRVRNCRIIALATFW